MVDGLTKIDKSIYKNGKTGSYATHLVRIDEISFDASHTVESASLRMSIEDRLRADIAPMLRPAEEKIAGSNQQALEKRLDELAESVPDKMDKLVESMMVPYRNRKDADYTAFHSDDDAKIAQKLLLMAEKLAIQRKLKGIYTEQLKTEGPDALDEMQSELAIPSLRTSRNNGGHAEVKILAIMERKMSINFMSQERYDEEQAKLSRIAPIWKDAEEGGIASVDKLKELLLPALKVHAEGRLSNRSAEALLKEVGPKDAKLVADLLTKHGVIDQEQRSKLPEALFIVPESRKKADNTRAVRGSHAANVAARRTVRGGNSGLDDSGDELPELQDGRTKPHIQDDDNFGKWNR